VKQKRSSGEFGRSHRPRNGSGGGFVPGREAFANISAIEGKALGAEMRKIFEEYDRKGLSAEERRRAIVQRFTRLTRGSG